MMRGHKEHFAEAMRLYRLAAQLTKAGDRRRAADVRAEGHEHAAIAKHLAQKPRRQAAAVARMARNPVRKRQAAPKPYSFVKDGKRVYFATVKAAYRAAQALADRLGKAVRVDADKL